MDVREKLVELFYENNVRCDQKIEGLADDVMNIIDNGVTVQEWISVTEMLPEETGRYLTANKRGDDKIDVFDLWFDGGFWYIDDEDDMFDYEVTHWMPMPHPPKGE